ncbi:MAG: ABC transporter ATP-binding protein [Desulfobacteraceae bacterium]|jgi:branched-chain amino acid transport system ATP-binding protein|nr:MAG: ABC transporter ATP-binding protein [Desulfobacteraceae bacterium]
MSDVFFSVDKLCISFGGLMAVDGVSFTVAKGTIFSIIGPNGAGKTTIFNCISGLYKPSSGSIVFQGEEITGLKPHKIAQKGIARTFQNIELFSRMTTMENLMLGRHVHMKTGVLSGATFFRRGSRAAREEILHRERVEKIIDLLDLQSARNHFVGNLPYGTQKLVELGRALALEPKMLLLDEPSAGMNSEEKQDLIFWIKDIQDELGVTILLIEHDMKMVMDISDRVLAINFGRPIVEGMPDEVQRHPDVLKAYLGEEEIIGNAA